MSNGTLSVGTITVKIAGADDAAVISGTSSSTVVEAGGVANGAPGTPTATGTLTDADVDNTPNTFQAVAAGAASTGGYGTYAMTAGGTWTYSLNNNNAAGPALHVGGHPTHTLSLPHPGGTAQNLTNGTTGAPDTALMS